MSWHGRPRHAAECAILPAGRRTVPAHGAPEMSEYRDHGRDRRKPKGSEEGVVHLLEFRDGSTIALGIDAPVAEGEDFLG